MAVQERQAEEDTWLDGFPHDWLLVQTGHDLKHWLQRVQQLIPLHSDPTSDPEHDFTQPTGWLADLSLELWACFKWPSTKDENMWFAACLGLILSAWYSGVQRAKSNHPARPVKIRQQVHGRWLHWLQALMAAITQENLQPTIFPAPKWDHPFHPDAMDGWFR